MIVYYDSDHSKTSQIIADRINAYTAKDKEVLWLLSGGSAISIATHAAPLLDKPHMITVTLGDERYGAVGHPDSNWQQLVDSGFPFDRFTAYPILYGGSAETTTAAFDTFLRDHSNHIVISLFGMGSDGHTAGILPDSPPFSRPKSWATHYVADDHHRITITPPYFTHIDEAVLQVFGEQKYPPLQDFIANDHDPVHDPVQLLKQVPTLIVCTDMEEML